MASVRTFAASALQFALAYLVAIPIFLLVRLIDRIRNSDRGGTRITSP